MGGPYTSLLIRVIRFTDVNQSCCSFFVNMRLFIIAASILSADCSSEVVSARVPKSTPVVGSIFSGPGKSGDFRWMADQPEYDRTLFVFNDNEEQYFAHLSGDRRSGCSVGGGNAAVRPLQCQEPPRAIGIPTGSRGVGYPALDDRVKSIIDQAVDRIRSLMPAYDQVVFSKDPHSSTLGTGIFKPSEDVKKYIYDSLMDLSD